MCIKGKKEEYCILSENFCSKDYSYKTALGYNLKAKANLDVLDDIREICKSDNEYLILLKDLKKFFMRDFYVSQFDRTGNNFMFKVGKEGIRLAPLYDYEYSFDSCNLKLYRNQIAEIDLSNRKTKQILTKDKVFQELLHSIMQISMEDFLQEVEDTHNISVPSDFKELYMVHDTQIKQLIKEIM